MKQFTLGSLVGLVVGASIAATPLQDKIDPCDGWKIDCLALEAALLLSVGMDYDKYQNTKDNLGVIVSRMIGGGMYKWESDKLRKSEQMVNDKIRESIILETAKYVEEMKKQKVEQTTLDA